MKISFQEIQIKAGVLTALVIRDTCEPDSLFVKLPSDIQLKDDLIALFFSTLVGRKYSYVHMDLGLSAKCKNVIEKFCGAKIDCKDNKEEVRELGCNYSLSFSGGFDSLAAKALLPQDTKLISLDFGGKFARERVFFEKFNPFIIETNIVDIGLNRNHWAFMAAGIILLRDYLSIRVASFGSILASSIPAVLSQRIALNKIAIFDYLDIDLLNPLAGITEIGAMSIALHDSPDSIIESLYSLANPMEGKFYRKTMALKAYLSDKEHNYTLPDPKPRGWYQWGKSYADDLSAIYICQKLGKESITNSYSEEIPPEIFDNIKNNFGFYFKYNRDAYSNINDEYRGYIFKKLEEINFYEYDEHDYADISLADYLIRGDDFFYKKYNNKINAIKKIIDCNLLKGDEYIKVQSSALHIKFNLEKIKKEKTMIVSFNGPVMINSNNLTSFDNDELLQELDIPFIIFLDPVVEKCKDIRIGWYLGNEEIADLPQEIANILNYMISEYNLNIILIGGLNGGFAALKIQQLLINPEKHTSLVWNPHTNIDSYYSQHVSKYIDAAFKKKNIKHIIEEYDLPIISKQVCRSIILINGYDNSNLRNHISPLIRGHDVKINLNQLTFDNTIIYLGDWGGGHVTPSKTFLLDSLNALIKNQSLSEVFNTDNFIEKAVFVANNCIGVSEKTCIVYDMGNGVVNLRCLLSDRYLGYQIKIKIKINNNDVFDTNYFLGAYDNECVFYVDEHNISSMSIEVIIEDLMGGMHVSHYYYKDFLKPYCFKVLI